MSQVSVPQLVKMLSGQLGYTQAKSSLRKRALERICLLAQNEDDPNAALAEIRGLAFGSINAEPEPPKKADA